MASGESVKLVSLLGILEEGKCRLFCYVLLKRAFQLKHPVCIPI